MRRVRAWWSDLPFADRVGLGLVPLFTFPDDETAAGIEPRPFDAVAALILPAAVLALSGYTDGGVSVPALVAFYHLGTTGDRRRQFGADAAMSQALGAVGYPPAAILFGEIVRSRRLLLEEHAAKARPRSSAPRPRPSGGSPRSACGSPRISTTCWPTRSR